MHAQIPGVLLRNWATRVCSRRTNYPLEKKIGDVREILTFELSPGQTTRFHRKGTRLHHQLRHQVSYGPEIENRDPLCLCEDNLKGEQQ